jgi:hypothetical protein
MKRLLLLLPVLGLTACAPVAGAMSAPAPKAAAVQAVGDTPISAPVVSPVSTVCDSEHPSFVLGFAVLKDRLGDKMGTPLECEHAMPNATAGPDTQQATTTGLAYWSHFPNAPAFTDGWDHWALTESGFEHWTGDVVDPPQLLPDDAAASQGLAACPLGQSPAFTTGFAALKDLLGERMGDATTCEHYLPGGDSMQHTTNGMAWYRHATNTPTFMQNDEHWALTEQGLVQWKGMTLDPPADAEVVGGDTPLMARQTVADGGPTPAPVPSAPPLPVLDGSVRLRGPGQPEWLEGPLHLLWGYDKVNGTMIVPTLRNLPVGVGPLLTGLASPAFGAYLPQTNQIEVDSTVPTHESDFAIAALLAHEASHAMDHHNGMPNTQAACYTTEISAHNLESRVWAAFYGPNGDPDAHTALELQENEQLKGMQTSAATEINGLINDYLGQCEVRSP